MSLISLMNRFFFVSDTGEEGKTGQSEQVNNEECVSQAKTDRAKDGGCLNKANHSVMVIADHNPDTFVQDQ